MEILYIKRNKARGLASPSTLSDNGIKIRLETDYPFKNKMHYTIEAERSFDFVIRIPSFAENLKVNGKEKSAEDLEFKINEGKTEIEIEFNVPLFLKKRPRDLYALQTGSLLFSVPIEYEKRMKEYVKKGVERKFPYCDYQFIPQTKWNYAFSGKDFVLKRGTVGDVPFSQENPPVVIKAKMQEINWGLKFPYKTICRKSPKSRKPLSEIKEIKLYPYGCSRLRMTEMPLLSK